MSRGLKWFIAIVAVVIFVWLVRILALMWMVKNTPPAPVDEGPLQAAKRP